MQTWLRAVRDGRSLRQDRISRSLAFNTSELSEGQFPTHLVLTEISRTTTHDSGKGTPDTVTLTTMDRAALEFDDGSRRETSVTHSQSQDPDFPSRPDSR